MCDQKGRRLRWETVVEQVGFEVSPEECDRGAISDLEGENILYVMSAISNCTLYLTGSQWSFLKLRGNVGALRGKGDNPAE